MSRLGRPGRAAILAAAALVTAALLTGCAAPTPVPYAELPAAPVVIVVTPEPSPVPTVPVPVVTAAPTPLVTAAPPPPTPLPPVQVIPAQADANPVPVEFPPPVTTPAPVLPPVVVPVAPPIGRFAEDLDGAVADAQLVVDGYWARHWGETFTGTYVTPTLLGLYDGTAAEVPLCGDERLPPYNAVYCVPGDYLAYDVTLMGLRTQIGNSWPYLVVAHEWGHAIQVRLDGGLNSLALELQADCFAGAALYGAVADGTLDLGPNAATEIATALTAAADETPWTDVRDHGNATERIGAFDAGRVGGVRACLPRA